MCECEKMDECQTCEHENTYRNSIIDAIQPRILPGLMDLIKANEEAQAELSALEAEQAELLLKMKKLDNDVRELSADSFGGPAIRMAILEATAERDGIRKQLDSLGHLLEPARSRAYHARDDLNQAGQRVLRDLQPEFQAKLQAILDEAASCCDGWDAAVHDVGVESGVNFGKSKLDPLAHPLISARRFGQR